MNDQPIITKVEILDAIKTGNKMIVTIQLLAGKMEGGMVLKTEDGTSSWKVTGMGTIPSCAWAKGIRRVVLDAPLSSSNQELFKGTLLLGC